MLNTGTKGSFEMKQKKKVTIIKMKDGERKFTEDEKSRPKSQQ